MPHAGWCLQSDVPPDHAFRFPTKMFQQIWLGTPGVVAELHYDLFDNFYTQVRP